MCNRKFFLPALFLSFFFRISAQQLQNQDAVTVSLSGTDIVCREPLYSANPALLQGERQRVLIMNLSNRYMLPELSTSSLAGVWSGENDTFTGMIGYFGSRILNELLVSVGYGRKVTRRLSGGIRLNYWQRKIAVYHEAQRTITGEIGIILQLSQNCHAGIHLVNPAGAGYPGSVEQLHQNLQIGIGYVHKDDFYLGTQLCLIDFHRPALSLGAGYYLVKNLVLRCGLRAGEYLSYSFGIGTAKGSLQMDLGVSTHMILGLSAACTLRIKIAGS